MYQNCKIKKTTSFYKNLFILTNDIVVAAKTNRMGLIPRRQCHIDKDITIPFSIHRK